MKKAFCIFLCLLTFMSVFASCKKSETENGETTVLSEETTAEAETQSEIKEKYVTLGYYSHESLNPFETESKTNKSITTLLYDSLFKLDSAFDAVNEIADSYKTQDDTLRVTLKDDVYFTDGTAVSASDVVYSFEKAQSAPLYKAHLSNFKSAYADSNSVVFTIYTPDIYAVNCLDFPICQYGTASNSKPVGSGRYTLEKSDGDYILKRNDNYSLGEELEQEKIKLYDINEAENEFYLLQIGELSYVYDDFSSESIQYKISANTAEVALNNLVFLSFNSESEILKDENIKTAVSLAIDKALICSNIYDSHASVSVTPFNPQWSVVSSFSKDNSLQNTTEAASLLENSGYVFEYDTNEYRSKNYSFLKLSLLVSEADEKKVEVAETISETLRKLGIDLTLEKCEQDEYLEKLEDGDFDMYIGEIMLSSNMNLAPFFSENGEANFGIDTSSTVSDAYFDFKEGKIDISTFVKVFDEYKPFVPICYKTAVAYYSRSLQYEGSISENDIFANAYSWSF